jgi:hypothetical protein
MAHGIVPGGCDTWEHVFEFGQTTVRKGSAASTQCRTSLRTRDLFDRLGQSPTRPGPREVDQVHPGKLPGVTGASRESAKDSPRPARDRLWTNAGTSLHFATVSTGGLSRKL